MLIRSQANQSFASSFRSRLPARRRGAAFLFTIFVLMVFSIVGMALIGTSNQALRLTRIREEQNTAFNLAESGAERACLWLRQQGAPPSSVDAFNPFGGAVNLGQGFYNVTVDGDANNPNTEAKAYTIRSTGVTGGRQETIQLYVRLSTFGRYAYFTDYETSSITDGAIWFFGGDRIDGPAHSNNSGGSIFQINYTSASSTDPIFKGGLTSAANSINWNPGQPSSEATYQKSFADGSRGFKLGVGRIELPANTDVQKRAAWGKDYSYPSTDGAYFTENAGIYIRGDATVEFVNESSKQVVQILRGSTRYKMTVDRVAGTTKWRVGDSDWNDGNGGGTVTSYNSLPNGVIYSTGNVTSLKGDLSDSAMDGSVLRSRNSWTVAADLVANKSVTITDNLEYVTQPDRSKSWSEPVNLKAAALGVVARNIKVSSETPSDLTINGVMLAGGRDTTDGSFYNEGYNLASTVKAAGTLHLLGGIIQKKRGPVGTLSSLLGTISTGYAKDYKYDARMAVNPPPFFPTTGTYDRLSWERVNSGSYTGTINSSASDSINQY